MRTINAKFLLVLVVLAMLSVGAVFGMHRLQASNIADALLWQANQAEKDGKLDRAAKFLGRYLEFARDDLETRDHLAMILSDPLVAISPQKRARARFVIEQVLAKDPQRHVLRQRLCQIAMAGRSFDVAKEHLNYLEKNLSSSAEVPYLVGLWHEAQNQALPAVEQYRRAIKSDATKVEAYLRLATLLRQMDFGKERRHAAEIDILVMTALEKAPRDAGVLSLAAQHAQERGDTRIALHYLEDGLKLHPTEPRLYLALSRIQNQNGKRAEAIEQLQLGLRKVRKDQQPELRWSLANLLLDESRLEESPRLIAEVREGNALSADYLDARLQMQRGRWFEAAKLFERIRPALKSSKELTLQLDLYLGACYEQLEEPVLQLTAFQRAAELDATSLTARRGMASARWALGQTGEAMQIYQDLVSRTKDPEEAAKRRLEYIRMLLQNGQPRQAKEWKKIEQEVNDVEKILIKSMDVVLVRAELYFVQGEKEKAENLLHDAIKEQSNRHEPWLALISFAAIKGDHEAARDLMRSAEERFKDKAEFRLAQIRFWTRHRPNEAIASLRALEPLLAPFPAKEQSALLQATAEAYFFANQYADAARAVRKMLELPQHKQDVRVRMQLLEVVLLQDDDAQARAVLKEIKQIERDGAGGPDWSFGEAQRLMREGRKGSREAFEQARHLLTMTAAQRPNWHPIVQTRAELDELQGKPDQAMANYRRALDLGSRDPHVMRQLIHLLSQAHRFEEVDEIIARMQKLYGSTEDVVKGFIHNAYHRQDYQKAEFLAKQLVAKNSKDYRDHLWLGQILTAGGKVSEDAEHAFRRAIALAPAQPETWIGLVRYLVSVGKIEPALMEMDQVKKAPLAGARDLTLAQCSEMIGALADAAQSYQSAVAAQPESALVHRAAADFFVRMGRPAQAEPLFRKVVERKLPAGDDDVIAARRGLALTLTKLNRPGAGLEALHLVGLDRDENGDIPDAKIADALEEQLVQAKVLASLNHYRLRGKAIAMLETLHQKNSLQAEDQFLLVRLLAQQGVDGAVSLKTRTLLRTLTHNYPRNPRFLAFAAHTLIRDKEFNDAEAMIARLEQVERQRKVTPGFLGAIELRAKVLEMRGLGTQAIAILADFAQQPEAPPVRKLLLAGLHGRLGNFRDAIDLCEEVKKTGASYEEACTVALAILRLNRPSEAHATKYEQWQEQRARVESLLRGALERDPSDIPLRLQLADVMEIQGKYDEVEKLCREVLRDQETNLVALNNLAWLLTQQPAKAAEAQTLINRAIDKYGQRPELLDTRAVIRLNRGDVNEALRDLERVVNEAPTPTRVFHLSQAYERAKNATSALTCLRRANEMGLTLQQLHPVERVEYQRAMANLHKR